MLCSGRIGSRSLIGSRLVSCFAEGDESRSMGSIDPGGYGLFADDTGRFLVVLGREPDA